MAENVDVQLPAGHLRVMVVDHAARQPNDRLNTAMTMHNTDALDIVYVVDGHPDLVLGAGTHTLGPGESVIMPGTDHAWKAGPAGVRFLVFSLGTPPPAEIR